MAELAGTTPLGAVVPDNVVLVVGLKSARVYHIFKTKPLKVLLIDGQERLVRTFDGFEGTTSDVSAFFDLHELKYPQLCKEQPSIWSTYGILIDNEMYMLSSLRTGPTPISAEQWFANKAVRDQHWQACKIFANNVAQYNAIVRVPIPAGSLVNQAAYPRVGRFVSGKDNAGRTVVYRECDATKQPFADWDREMAAKIVPEPIEPPRQEEPVQPAAKKTKIAITNPEIEQKFNELNKKMQEFLESFEFQTK